MAKKIFDIGMEFPAILILQTLKPFSYIGGELSILCLAPYLPLLEDKGYEFIDTFEKRENIDVLVRSLERLSMEKAKESEKIQEPSLWSRLKSKFLSS